MAGSVFEPTNPAHEQSFYAASLQCSVGKVEDYTIAQGHH